MGELLTFPSRDAAQRPLAAPVSALRLLDDVVLLDERLADGRLQPGRIERLHEGAFGASVWVRRSGGPRAGDVRVVDIGLVQALPHPAVSPGDY